MTSEVSQAHPQQLFNPFAKDMVANPYAQYQRLRSEDPVHWSSAINAWVLTRFDDVRAVLNDETFEAVETSKILAEVARKSGRDYGPIIRVLDATLFFKRGPEHRQSRRTISKIVNRVPLRQLEPTIDDIASSLAAKLSGRIEYDAVEEFADPLPHLVMAHILGLPPKDIPVLSEMLSDMTLIFDTVPMRTYDRINSKVAAALDLLSSRIEEANQSPAESGLSIIYDGTPGSGKDRLADAAAMTLFTFRVGSETTMGLIGLLIHTLLDQPELYRLARENPTLAPVIVSEVLRLESNVQRSLRVGQEPRLIGGKIIQPGERVLLLLGAANRDPITFVRPNDVSLESRAEQDVAFGGGGHFCLGASLARLEARIALEHFLRLPPVERADEGKWYLGQSIHRLTQLPVRTIGDASIGRSR